MANCSDSCGAPVPPGRYAAKFLGVKHEAVFEIAEGMQAGETVRLEFEYGEIAERVGPSIHKLLTDRTATSAAKRLHDALARFLDDGDGGQAAADVIRHAGAVVHQLNIFHSDFGTDFEDECDCETR